MVPKKEVMVVSLFILAIDLDRDHICPWFVDTDLLSKRDIDRERPIDKDQKQF